MAKQTDTPAVADVPGVEGLTFSDLEVHYGTGRSCLIKKDGKRNVTRYRHGVMTKSGDYEIHEWKRLVRQLIEQSGEQELQAQLIQWEREHRYARCNDKEIEQSALELHARRIFDDRQCAISSHLTGSSGRKRWKEWSFCGFGRRAAKRRDRLQGNRPTRRTPKAGRYCARTVGG